MTAMSTVAADFNKSGYGVVIQTPSLHPGLFSVLMLCSSGTDIKERMRKFSRTTHVFALARDQGSGTMVDSPNCISYQLKDVDRDNLSKGIEKEESSMSFTDLLTPVCSAHQMGSCRMGTNPKESVVNQMGETWEVEGLYLADSSVFPTALGVNPMVTIQAIAYCTAQHVLEVLKRKR
ncbi:unnamed protein product [Trifolium pratense]|uniref:Uncharacterized protein n=1 Tax=Trifolium pratense TaxID=57577 RepID=A0ACB0IVS3_TRIPR|nr:unnamed protein product [Trifolium pratense]